MGNALRRFKGEDDDHAGGVPYPYYYPTSRPSHILQARILQARDRPAAPPTPTHQLVVGPHGVMAATAGVVALDQYIPNFKSTSMERPKTPLRIIHRGGSTGVAGGAQAPPTTAEPLEPHLSPTAVEFLEPRFSTPLSAAAPCRNKKKKQTAAPNFGHQKGSSDIHGNRVVASKHQRNTGEDIDESSAEVLCDAESYAKANPMLIKVKVAGTAGKKTFWRLSDEAGRISRKLAFILRRHHSVGKYLVAPLKVSNVRISSSGSTVKLRGVRFGSKSFSLKRVRNDYRNLSRMLKALIRISGGNITRLPPDYKDFLALLASDTLTMEDEFLIVNNPALLPMSNRTEVFLMLYDRIITKLGWTKDGEEKKKRILLKLPYENDWLDTAIANTEINEWVKNVQKQYRKTQLDQLRLNRNVRSHLWEYGDKNIEEVLYYEWPKLLMDMVKMLHEEGELQNTDIQIKFG